MKRVLIYAGVYASIGAIIGVMMALYMQDAQGNAIVNPLFNRNHRSAVDGTAVEPTPSTEAKQDAIS